VGLAHSRAYASPFCSVVCYAFLRWLTLKSFEKEDLANEDIDNIFEHNFQQYPKRSLGAMVARWFSIRELPKVVGSIPMGFACTVADDVAIVAIYRLFAVFSLWICTQDSGCCALMSLFFGTPC
jgi:hypothetical protein